MDQVTEIFAGIGFSEVLRPLGLHGRGLEMDPVACATRRAAGHGTVECDVTAEPTARYAGTSGLVGGPPCPPFGKSGRRLGLTDLPLVHEAIDDLARGLDTRGVHAARCLDPRSILTAEPMRWLYGLRPDWVVLEQVPAVLPVWRQYAEILDGWGYTRRPSPAVTGGGVYTGGAEPFGNGSRQAMRKVIGADAWKDRAPLCTQCLADRKRDPDGPCRHLRPTLAECAALQGFRPGLVFHGNSGQRHLQVGNAVPKALARAAVLAASGAGERAEVLAA